MKLGRNSWHYGIVEHVFGPEYFFRTVNLCKYFWSVVVAMIAYPFDKAIEHLPKWKFNFPVNIKLPEPPEWAEKLGTGLLIAFLTFMMWLVGFVVLYSWLLALIIPGGFWVSIILLILLEDRVSFKARPKQPRSPNLLAEYLKAKKRKVCPLINFE